MPASPRCTHAPGSTFDARRLVRQCSCACLRAAVDIGACVARVVQDIQDAAVAQWLPDQLASAGFAPEAIGDFVARDQLAVSLEQQNKQLHGELLQAQEAPASFEPITGLIECEFAEMEFLGRTSPAWMAEFVSKNDAPSGANKQPRQ